MILRPMQAMHVKIRIILCYEVTLVTADHCSISAKGEGEGNTSTTKVNLHLLELTQMRPVFSLPFSIDPILDARIAKHTY